MQFDHGYALLIGVGAISKYAEWSLPMTVNDATILKSLLIDQHFCGYPDNQQHIRLLTDTAATKDSILDGLDWLATCADNDPAATILFFYSGHGWIDKQTGAYYLVQHDVSPVNLAETALSAHDITEKLRAINAQRLLAIFDCCHAQGMATSKGELAKPVELPTNLEIAALPKSLVNDLKQGQGRAVFTSSLGNQRSWMRDETMSLYTYHLIEALEGAGNKAGDTTVRISNLMNYLGAVVPASAQMMGREQTPFFDTASEDFPIALLLGGKGLGVNGWVKAEPSTSSIPSRQVTQSAGDHAILVGGDAKHTIFNTGNGNQFKQSHYTLKGNQIENSAIGDGANVTNKGNLNISGSTVGSAVGINYGTISQESPGKSAPITLGAIIKLAETIAEQMRDEECWEQLQLVLVQLNAALRAEKRADTHVRSTKIQLASSSITALTASHSECIALEQQIKQLI
ncbi:caspase family protein [Herpetosiphon gulosus]|uniref:Peptidase C14 caspase domain-containing protein n=1 Tax=Herpetosiphon gulosus TaxID=1973496 RepID=A0ABP9X0N3_9CHLR